MEKYVKRIIKKGEKVGWKGLPLAAFKSIGYRIKYLLKIIHTKFVLQNTVLAYFFPFNKPTILLYGFARSGTSWAARILSYSPQLAYIREPVTQTFIQKYNYDPPFFHPKNKEVNKNFKIIAEQTMKGIPSIDNVISNRSDFSLFARKKKKILIKEVEKQSIEYFVENYPLKIIVLLRHPAAIADSRMRMGWLKRDESKEFGFTYGTKIYRILESIKASNKVNHKIVFYESIAENPREGFKKIFHYLEVDIPDNFDAIIKNYCKSSNQKWHPYRTQRKSEVQIKKWKQNLDDTTIEAIKRGFFKSDLAYYRSEKYWR